MKFIKKNFKIILAFFLGIILAGGVSIYAAIQYNASDVRQVKEGFIKTEQKLLQIICMEVQMEILDLGLVYGLLIVKQEM